MAIATGQEGINGSKARAARPAGPLVGWVTVRSVNRSEVNR